MGSTERFVLGKTNVHKPPNYCNRSPQTTGGSLLITWGFGHVNFKAPQHYTYPWTKALLITYICGGDISGQCRGWSSRWSCLTGRVGALSTLIADWRSGDPQWVLDSGGHGQPLLVAYLTGLGPCHHLLTWTMEKNIWVIYFTLDSCVVNQYYILFSWPIIGWSFAWRILFSKYIVMV